MDVKKVLALERTKNAKVMMEIATNNYTKNRDEALKRVKKDELKEKVRKRLNIINTYLENERRIKIIAKDIKKHFEENIDGKFKAIIVACNRKACVHYKRALDEIIPKEYDSETKNKINIELPGKIKSFSPILFPIVLIALKSIADFPSHPFGAGGFLTFFDFIGHPINALMISFRLSSTTLPLILSPMPSS